MATEPYTHDFTLTVGDQDITGEIEFNVDGKVSYKTDAALVGLTLEQDRRINELFGILKDVFNDFGSITKIQIEVE